MIFAFSVKELLKAQPDGGCGPPRTPPPRGRVLGDHPTCSGGVAWGRNHQPDPDHGRTHRRTDTHKRDGPPETFWFRRGELLGASWREKGSRSSRSIIDGLGAVPDAPEAYRGNLGENGDGGSHG